MWVGLTASHITKTKNKMKHMKNLNYSLRYLLKNRGNSVTRLVSLAIGLIIALLICSYVGLNLSYGRFFPDRERVYQVFSTSPQYGISHMMVRPLAPNLAADIPQIEAATHCTDQLLQLKVGDGTIEAVMSHVGSDFFTVLDFGVVSGNPKRILSAEGLANNEVMISERLAERIFGDEDPLGKVIEIAGSDEQRIVAGIFRTPPVTSPLNNFDLVCWLRYDPEKEMWLGGDSFPTFIKLREGAEIVEVEGRVEAFAEAHGLTEYLKEWQMSFFFVPIEDAFYVDNNHRSTQTMYGLLALLAMVVACFNYVLLTLSSLAKRSRTIAMLRCNGASRGDIFRMLLVETLLMVVASIGLAIFILASLHNEIYQLLGYHLGDLFAWERIWIPTMVCIASFLVAGIVPAALFSTVRLEYAFRRGGDNRGWWKRVLLIVQIACTTGIVCFLLVTAQQADYVMKADLGYKYDRVVSINLNSTASERTTLVEEVRRLPFVEEAAFSYQYPIWGYWGDPVRDEQGNLLFSCRGEYFDEYYIPTMQMEIVEGRNFTEQDNAYKMIVNEEFVRQHGWKVGEAVGKHFYQGGLNEVVGVVRDFQQAGGFVIPLAVARLPWRPVADREQTKDTFQLSMRLQSLSTDNLKALDQVIKAHYPSDWQYTIIPYADRIKERFAFRDQLRNNVLIVTLATMLISLLGLVGYIAGEMARRRKEIALRKVCGATTGEVLRLLSLNLSRIILPAIIAGVAGAAWGSHRYVQLLETMCEEPAWWNYALGVLIVLIIIYTILVIRTWRTANANPVDMIKVEN